MRNISKWSLVAVMGFVLVACQMAEPTSKPEVALRTAKRAVIGGTIDNRLPGVGTLVANRRSFCTGTLIASRLVVTAAHCITAAQRSMNRNQTVQFRIDLPTGQGTNFKATYHDVGIVKTHPQYSSSRGGLANDVGYMTLKKDVAGVTPIPINTTKLDQTWVGKQVTFLGYGLIQTQPRPRSPGRKYSANITLRTVSADRIRTQDKGKSICSGDSGGPGLYKFNGEMRIIAVNSYVTGRTSGRQPLCDGAGWSFRVDYYVSWLQPLINKYGGKCKSDKDCGPCYRCDAKKGKCVVKGTTPTQEYCKPCTSPSSCGGTGQSNICQRQSVGNRCLQACDAQGCCPLGTSCRIVGGSNQCVPNKATCADVACQTDKECGPGEGCSKGTCRPKPVAPAATLCRTCATDADCSGGVCTSYPDGKRCTQPCVADNFCPKGYTCQSLNNKRQCVATSGDCGCKANTDCHSGFACQKGLCVRVGGGKYGDSCSSKRGCAKGYRCTPTQASGTICIQTCSGAYAAGQPGSVCASGKCVGGASCQPLQGNSFCLSKCSSDTDCKNGGSCRQLGGSLSVCICQSDSVCKNGATCNDSVFGRYRFGLCAQKNNTKSECEKGFECRSTGGHNYCLPGPTQQSGDECNNSTKSCKAGHLCAQTERGNALCIRECRSDSDCLPEGGACTRSGGTSFCSCNQTACSQGYTCKAISSRNKICIRGGCTSNAGCTGGLVCLGGKCQSKTKPECAKDSDCPQGQLCQRDKCVKKPACVSDGDCGAGLGCVQGSCVPKKPTTCAKNGDCQATYICRNSQCVPPDSCDSNKDCKTGFICEFNVCVKDTSPAPPKPPVTKPDAGSTDKVGTVDKGTKGSDPSQTPIDNACGCSAESSKLPSQSVIWLLLLFPFLAMRRRHN